MLQMLEQFFDHAIFYAAMGYERAMQGAPLAASGDGRIA